MVRDVEAPDPGQHAARVHASPHDLRQEPSTKPRIRTAPPPWPPPPRYGAAPPHHVPPPPRHTPPPETGAGFFGARGPLLFFALLTLIPALSVALWLLSPPEAVYEQPTLEEWERLMHAAPPAGEGATTPPPSPRLPTELRVESDPEASFVYIDGKLDGVTPYQSGAITSGWLAVSLEKSGYAIRDTLLYLEPERTTVLSLTLDPLADAPLADVAPASGAPPSASAEEPAVEDEPQAEVGELLVEATPARVPVFVNGLAAGSTPLLLSDLARGTHEVALILAGYVPQTFRVYVAPGERATLRVDLVPSPPR